MVPLVLTLLLGCTHAGPTFQSPHRGAVAADHVLASEAGAEMLRRGGNAVDAAIAAALSQGVVQPTGSGLGGGGFAIVVKQGQPPFALDFREVAPAAATPDMFASGASSTKGGLAVAVPAEGIGLAELHRHYGTLPLTVIAGPAIEQASKGFTPGQHLLDALASSPGMRGLFGENYVRPKLAEALRAWAQTDGAAMQTGWVAQDFVDTTRAHGGVLTMEDLAAYRPEVRNVLSGTWHGDTIYTFPPPSSGGIALLQVLRATDGVDDLHCKVEAAKHAMADRAAFGGDPSFVSVPVDELLSDAHVAAIRADCAATTFPPDHYAPVAPPPTDHGTLHIATMDDQGMAVALTTTVNLTFGAELEGARSGIVLNDEMDDFSTKPGQENAFHLVQGSQNAPQPHKRPLSSMTPTIVVDSTGLPILSVGASGGPFIITATWQVLEDVLARGMSAKDAVSAPRWHHQWMPDAVMTEAGVPGLDTLQAHGHVLKTIDHPFSAVQVVHRTGTGFDAASDPRKGGEAVVVDK